MKIKNKTIRLLSSILLFPILSIISWAATMGCENMAEENLIAEYSQREQEQKNADKSTEETEQQTEQNQQESSSENKESDEKSKQKSSTSKSTAQKNQSSSKSETTNKSSSQNNTSSTSTAQSNTNTNSSTSQPTQTNPEQSTDQNNYEAEVVKLCNDARKQAGVAALLNQNSKLQQAADIRASEIKQSFSHTRPNGTTAYTVLSEVGISYNTWGENIAYGQKTPQEVVNAWMNSPGHRANILNANFKEIAVGMKDYYWVQEFI